MVYLIIYHSLDAFMLWVMFIIIGTLSTFTVSFMTTTIGFCSCLPSGKVPTHFTSLWQAY